MKRYIQPPSGEYLLLITRSQFLKGKSSSEGRECMSTARNGDFLWFYMENIYHQS